MLSKKRRRQLADFASFFRSSFVSDELDFMHTSSLIELFLEFEPFNSIALTGLDNFVNPERLAFASLALGYFLSGSQHFQLSFVFSNGSRNAFSFRNSFHSATPWALRRSAVTGNSDTESPLVGARILYKLR